MKHGGVGGLFPGTLLTGNIHQKDFPTLLISRWQHEWTISSPPCAVCITVNHSQSVFQGPLSVHTLGIFLRLRLYGSPERQGVSSGLLGVEGGLIREDAEMLVSLLILRSSRSLKLRLSEVCLKKPGLEES